MAITIPSVSSSAQGTLSAAGVGSGLDIKSLISQLMSVEQQPLTLLNTKEAGFQAELTMLGSVKGGLSSLQSAAQALAKAGNTAYRAMSSNTSVLTGTADSTASAGTYAVKVTQLASVQKLITDGQASATSALGTGAPTTVTISLGTISGGTLSNGRYTDATFTANPGLASVSLTIDATNNTLTAIRDAINAANAGVTASLVNDGSGTPYRLALATDTTGADHSLQISVSGDATIASLLAYDPAGTQNAVQTQAAQNAQLTVDGVSVTSSTNSVAGAIQGVTLSLAQQQADADNPLTLTVQRDTSALNSALAGLVKAYNDINSTLASAMAKGAALQGDAGMLSLQHQLRSLFGNAQSTGGVYTMLSQLGVSFQKDGTLQLDSTKLGTALSGGAGDAAKLATMFGNALDKLLDGALSDSGAISSETGGINRSIKDIDAQRTRIQQQLDVTQQRYQAQFSALDTLLASMNTTSSFLTQQLTMLQNITANSKG